MRVCAKEQSQGVLGAPKAPNYKHQITNKLQTSKFQLKEECLGHLKLKFRTYLGFGICHLEFQPVFCSGYAGFG
jgi:hypothetical protein